MSDHRGTIHQAQSRQVGREPRVTTWTMHQVAQARGIQAKAQVAEELIASARVDVLDALARKLAARMNGIAHDFGLDLSEQDVRTTVSAAAGQPLSTVEVSAWWEPETLECEFVGGRLDGMIVAVRDAGSGNPVLIPQLPISPLIALEQCDAPVVPLPQPLRYTCTGWHEQERRWIYTLQGS